MKQEVLSQFDLPWLPITALVIFLVCFGIYAYWAFKKENKPMWEQMSQLPLAEENKE